MRELLARAGRVVRLPDVRDDLRLQARHRLPDGHIDLAEQIVRARPGTRQRVDQIFDRKLAVFRQRLELSCARAHAPRDRIGDARQFLEHALQILPAQLAGRERLPKLHDAEPGRVCRHAGQCDRLTDRLDEWPDLLDGQTEMRRVVRDPLI